MVLGFFVLIGLRKEGIVMNPLIITTLVGGIVVFANKAMLYKFQLLRYENPKKHRKIMNKLNKYIK